VSAYATTVHVVAWMCAADRAHMRAVFPTALRQIRSGRKAKRHDAGLKPEYDKQNDRVKAAHL